MQYLLPQQLIIICFAKLVFLSFPFRLDLVDVELALDIGIFILHIAGTVHKVGKNRKQHGRNKESERRKENGSKCAQYGKRNEQILREQLSVGWPFFDHNGIFKNTHKKILSFPSGITYWEHYILFLRFIPVKKV